MSQAEDLWVWVDLEMTGLDPATCTVVEIATLVTDSELRVLAEGPNLVIHQPDAVLEAMDPAVQAMHARSGLTSRIRSSTTSLAEAEAQTLAFLQEHVAPGKAPLCGNSVWKDRAFLERYLPSVPRHLHYRMIDVSSIKECVRRWYGQDLLPKKAETHRALDDILESIAELAWYRSRVFVPLRG